MYLLWRNMALSLLIVVLLVLLSNILPVYLAPFLSTICAFVIYLTLYTPIGNKAGPCYLFPFSIFISLISYTFVLVGINLVNIWTYWDIYDELVFFTRPYIPVLVLGPVSVLTLICLYFMHDRSSVCIDCRVINGPHNARGRIGIMMEHESKWQLKNLIFVFTLISAISWGYFYVEFNPISISARDSFVFTWEVVIILIVDIVYFAMRYYNLYLDLKEHDEVVSPEELDHMVTRTYVRYYIICNDSVFINLNAPDILDETDTDGVIETPFMISRQTNNISSAEVKSAIEKLSGTNDGKIRFFFGRKSPDNAKYSVMRYFYFLPGEISDYPTLDAAKGDWISSEKFKTLLYGGSLRFSPMLNADMMRLSTILITSKTYDRSGMRRMRLKQYHPSFTFEEIESCELDFQDNTWLRISCFNSDMPYFKIKRWWQRVTRSSSLNDNL